MSRRPKDPLRPLTEPEQQQLEEISRSRAAPAIQVARAQALLAVAAGHSYTAAAQQAGRVSGDAVSHLVARFNVEGMLAVPPGHGGGPPLRYGAPQREQILRTARRTPDREQDGTATWSLTTLQQALRQAGEPALPQIGRYTIWCVLRQAGLSWQQSRTWCDTGTVQRRRKSGVVTVYDPDSEAKKN
jgi:transposase